MATRYYDSHDFLNKTDKTITILVEHKEVVHVRDESGRPSDAGYYRGEEFGTEVEIEPNHRVSTVSLP